MKWDSSVHNGDGEPVFFKKHLFHWRGWRIDLHKFVKADKAGCFHTHPAHAFRIVLWGGYVEEVYVDFPGEGHFTYNRFCTPGFMGFIKPELKHRIGALLNGKNSYSMWLRAPVIADINVEGCD